MYYFCVKEIILPKTCLVNPSVDSSLFLVTTSLAWLLPSLPYSNAMRVHAYLIKCRRRWEVTMPNLAHVDWSLISSNTSCLYYINKHIERSVHFVVGKADSSQIGTVDRLRAFGGFDRPPNRFAAMRPS